MQSRDKKNQLRKGEISIKQRKIPDDEALKSLDKKNQESWNLLGMKNLEALIVKFHQISQMLKFKYCRKKLFLEYIPQSGMLFVFILDSHR